METHTTHKHIHNREGSGVNVKQDSFLVQGSSVDPLAALVSGRGTMQRYRFPADATATFPLTLCLGYKDSSVLPFAIAKRPRLCSVSLSPA